MVADSLQELREFCIHGLGFKSLPLHKANKHPHVDLFGWRLWVTQKFAQDNRNGVKLVSKKEIVLISHSLIKKESNNGKYKKGSTKEISCEESSS
jgi:hypothetical protein